VMVRYFIPASCASCAHSSALNFTGLNRPARASYSLTGIFARLGWNDEKAENYGYTECDRAFSVGMQVSGRRWDRRFTRAALVRETLAATPDSPVSALYALVTAAVADLTAAGVALPAPTRAAVSRLISALAAATPRP